ncbi:hypothetical protein PoB_001639300 [Plakobranchus ocellatus]|uniref:Uncharacterized protein n=1 Tax=Plakobranchus ocellatus TaxID=259542 RepID=A0AAV3Z609_9GAST|nr:hypothetical protein PoB_001639300 [Plakobranchus ocellatus]
MPCRSFNTGRSSSLLKEEEKGGTEGLGEGVNGKEGEKAIRSHVPGPSLRARAAVCLACAWSIQQRLGGSGVKVTACFVLRT